MRWHTYSLVAFGLVFPAASASPAAEVTKGDLLTLWEANWASLSALEVAFENLNEGSANGLEPLPRVEYEYRWMYGQYWSRMSRPEGIFSEVSFDYTLFDGRRYHSTRVGWVSCKDYGPQGAVWAYHMLRPPWVGVNPNPDALSDLSAMLADDHSRLRAQHETVEGRVAAVLDLYQPRPENTAPGGPWGEDDERVVTTVWLDVERAVPLKWTRYAAPNGAVSATVELKDYVQIEEVWLPTCIELSAAGLRTVQRVLRDNGNQLRLRINRSMGPEELTVQFPNKTTVIDEDTGELWIAAAPGRTLDETIRNIALVVDNTHLEGAEGASKDPWYWPGVALAGLVTGCLVGYVRRAP